MPARLEGKKIITLSSITNPEDKSQKKKGFGPFQRTPPCNISTHNCNISKP